MRLAVPGDHPLFRDQFLKGRGRVGSQEVKSVSLYPTGAGVFDSLFVPDRLAMSGWQALQCCFLL